MPIVLRGGDGNGGGRVRGITPPYWVRRNGFHLFWSLKSDIGRYRFSYRFLFRVLGLCFLEMQVASPGSGLELGLCIFIIFSLRMVVQT